jgi:type IV secretion system protein VirB3
MSSGQLRHTPIQRVLHRENLLMGGERELVMFTALVAGGIILTSQNLMAVAVGIPLYVICLALLRMMAKADPEMSRVFLRQRRYQSYYPARSTPFVYERSSSRQKP